jgi:hypothetical protein
VEREAAAGYGEAGSLVATSEAGDLAQGELPVCQCQLMVIIFTVFPSAVFACLNIVLIMGFSFS